MGNGGCGQFITCCLCCSSLLRGEEDFSHSSPAPAWVPSHERQISMNCFSMGTSHWVGNPANKPTPVWAPLHGAAGPGTSLLQRRIPTGSHPPLGIHLLWCGVFHRLQVDICSTVDLHGLQGNSLPHHGLLHGLQGHLCSGTWSTSSPSFFTNLGVCRVVSLRNSYSSLPLQLPLCRGF